VAPAAATIDIFCWWFCLQIDFNSNIFWPAVTLLGALQWSLCFWLMGGSDTMLLPQHVRAGHADVRANNGTLMSFRQTTDFEPSSILMSIAELACRLVFLMVSLLAWLLNFAVLHPLRVAIAISLATAVLWLQDADF
jgi:hypothetical protein